MGYRKIMIVADTHGNEINAKASELAFKFLKDFKPDLRIHLGDFINCEALRTGAGEAERRVGLKEDRDSAVEFLERFDPNFVLWGNHDDRLIRYVKFSPGPMADYCSEIVSSIRASCSSKTIHFPYDKRKGVCKIGKLRCLHGFFAGVNAPQMHARAYGSCVFGHTHRFSTVSVPGAHSGDRAVARGCGTLSELDLEYNARQVDTLSQAQGWLYGVMDKRGRYWLANAEVVEGKVAVADNFRVLE